MNQRTTFAISYYLSQERREHVVLERAPAVAKLFAKS
jgi:hypothetical protein